jgi:hypothetical protein
MIDELNEKNMDNQKQEEAFSFLKDKDLFLFLLKRLFIKQPLFFYFKVIKLE